MNVSFLNWWLKTANSFRRKLDNIANNYVNKVMAWDSVTVEVVVLIRSAKIVTSFKYDH